MSTATAQIIPLPSHFSQVQLSGLKELIDHHLLDDKRVQFDAAQVERIDGAAVQFLVASSQLPSQANSEDVLVINASNVIMDACTDMGVSEMIKIVMAEEPVKGDAES